MLYLFYCWTFLLSPTQWTYNALTLTWWYIWQSKLGWLHCTNIEHKEKRNLSNVDVWPVFENIKLEISVYRVKSTVRFWPLAGIGHLLQQLQQLQQLHQVATLKHDKTKKYNYESNVEFKICIPLGLNGPTYQARTILLSDVKRSEAIMYYIYHLL